MHKSCGACGNQDAESDQTKIQGKGTQPEQDVQNNPQQEKKIDQKHVAKATCHTQIIETHNVAIRQASPEKV